MPLMGAAVFLVLSVAVAFLAYASAVTPEQWPLTPHEDRIGFWQRFRHRNKDTLGKPRARRR